ncbi:hypothetical protein HU200_025777 [Digitaria exilis]|uniref:Uncharacterized protein n=1 Tax=Digitaria exilis TaxID=1010633 RepID=A0A835BWG5_9POAL|nr:hypothetical protein HU200_025777 [Digitaria exilis]
MALLHRALVAVLLLRLALGEASTNPDLNEAGRFDPTGVIHVSWHPRVFLHKRFLSDADGGHQGGSIFMGEGEVVEEGVDFAQDSEFGGGDDFLFVSETDEEISDEFVDISFVPETGDPSASNARVSPSPSTVPLHSIGSFDNNMERVHGLEVGA